MLPCSYCAVLVQDDRYFLSGSLDGKLRLWNIPDKKVALWNEIEGVGEYTQQGMNCLLGVECRMNRDFKVRPYYPIM